MAGSKPGEEEVIEQPIVVVRGFEGKRKASQAISFIWLNGVVPAIGNYVDGLYLSDIRKVMNKISRKPTCELCLLPSEKDELLISDSI